MTLMREIDLSILGEGDWPDWSQPRPDLTFVPVASLRINEAYQRPVTAAGVKNIRRIIAGFDWGRFSPLLVARVPASDLFAVIDGQHRAHAAAALGIDAVPAMIVDMDESAQAAAFVAVNSQVTKMTPQQIYRAALAALEPWALQSREAVDRAGCELLTYNPSSTLKKPGQITCVFLIRDAVGRGAGAAVSSALGGIRQSPDGDNVSSYANDVLRAMIAACESNGVTRIDPVEEFLRTMPLRAIERSVNAVRARHDFDTSEPYRATYIKSVRALMWSHLRGQE